MPTNLNPLPVRVDSTDPASGTAFFIVQKSEGSNALALSIVSTNPNDTTLGVRGRETGRGTIKATNERVDGKPNGNAAVLSLRAEATGAEQTNAQAIFFDAPGRGTTGKLLNLRNAGRELLVLYPDGDVKLSNGVDSVILAITKSGGLEVVTKNGITKVAA